jgi:phosphate starvation-inducible PhoH-like protein
LNAISGVKGIALTPGGGWELGFCLAKNQKVDPTCARCTRCTSFRMGLERVQKAFERQQIEIAPLAFMRRTLNHAFIIPDEAQNTRPSR